MPWLGQRRRRRQHHPGRLQHQRPASHLRGVPRPLPRLLAHQLADEGPHAGGDTVRERGRLVAEVREGRGDLRLAAERLVPGEALVRDQPERVEVRPGGRRGVPAALLRAM